jgi:hypothetical protein
MEATINAYLSDWAQIQQQTPASPNRDFYMKWSMFLEAVSGIRGVEDLPMLDQYSVGNTVSIIVRRRIGLHDTLQ